MEKLIASIKEATIETMKSGATGEEIGKILADKFGFEMARLVMADIALDLGMKSEVKAYLANF